MRRSRAALSLFLGALAAALQTAGLADVPRSLATEQTSARRPVDCYADAPQMPIVRPVAFAEDWYLDTCRPEFDCYGAHGVDCYNGPVAAARQEPVLLDAQPIDEYEYGYQWECECYCDDECDVYLCSPRVHLEDISHLAADARHSAGQEEVLCINRENEGLQAAALSEGDYPRDLPAGEMFYVSRVATGRISSSFECDDLYHGCADYGHSDCYGTWYCDEYASDCRQDEPSDLPVGETELHVAQTPAIPSIEGYDDYEYDYGYDYSQYGPATDSTNDDYTYDSYTDDSYSYDDYSEAYSTNASALPDDLPAGEVLTDDLPPAEDVFDDMPPGELTDDLPPAEDATNDLPPGEGTDDLPTGEFGGYDLPSHEVLSADLPAGEEISDLPPAELDAPSPTHVSREAYRNEYECDYGYHCEYGYDHDGHGATHAVSHPQPEEMHSEDAATSLRPVLRTASWMLNQVAEALLGLSRSVDQMADAASQEPAVEEATQVTPEMEYPWPTILGRQPNRDIHPGL